MNYSILYPNTKITLKFTLLIISILNLSCSKDNDDIEQIIDKNQAQVQIIDDSLLLEDESVISTKILEVINTYRVSKNLSTLTSNRNAKKCALKHSIYMAHIGEMNHDDFKDRSKTLFKLENAEKTGENVAYGYDTAKELVKAWIASPNHKRNIEGDFTNSGIGTIVDDNGMLYFTQIFFK